MSPLHGKSTSTKTLSKCLSLNPLLSAQIAATCPVSLHSQQIAVSCPADHEVWSVCSPLIPMDLPHVLLTGPRATFFLFWDAVSLRGIPSLLPKLQIRNCEGSEMFLGLQASKPACQPDTNKRHKTPGQSQRLFLTAKAAWAAHALISTSRDQMSASCSGFYHKREPPSFRRCRAFLGLLVHLLILPSRARSDLWSWKTSKCLIGKESEGLSLLPWMAPGVSVLAVGVFAQRI